MNTDDILEGFCHCGCGQRTKLNKHGRVPYKPRKFITGHNFRKGTERERFFSHFKMGKPDECWLWTAATSSGYGNFDNKIASRVAYRLEYGAFPEELFVLHKCDTPLCVNPAHLYLGTVLDNSHDMWARGRANPVGSPGSKQPNSKLTESQVTEIRRLYKKGKLSQSDIAGLYGVKPNTINAIVHHVRWKHLP